jgi:hypothetical protein
MTALALPLPSLLAIFATSADQQFERVCASCQKARGEKPQANQSHGYCPRHMEAMREASKWLKRAEAWRDRPYLHDNRGAMRTCAQQWRFWESQASVAFLPAGSKLPAA